MGHGVCSDGGLEFLKFCSGHGGLVDDVCGVNTWRNHMRSQGQCRSNYYIATSKNLEINRILPPWYRLRNLFSDYNYSTRVFLDVKKVEMGEV
jgi:hypothetical protein